MATPILDIACLCAAWCGTCGEYEATFAQLQAALPGHRYRWIDIEDEADLVGDVDVETFPTLLVARDGQVLFAGPVLPRLADAQRLIEVLVSQAQAEVSRDAAALGLPMDQWLAFTALARTLASAG
ncbi:MAG TPA: thioredoxin family protein [Aquabacterium sp.]|uniref:thioredoxin family protein n=1 Tax=Aquabacterium sp. TaxID=1872578 RepID=UPI002E34FA88|nr:thioredoxin family protein [Aquabacterium sp.]HEX5371943.1 thioredoxin family protein [Aquabacterium sp.]